MTPQSPIERPTRSALPRRNPVSGARPPVRVTFSELTRSSALGLVLALGIAAILLGSCAKKKGGPGGGFQMPPLPVEVSEVKPQTVRDQFHALGSIESDEIIDVVSELNATVVRIPFVEGQRIAKGGVLTQLDDREIRAAAQRAAAQREQAKSAAGRAEKLFQQSAISQIEMDDARTALKIAEANEALARAQLSKTRIVAPWSGLAGRRRVSPGAYLKSGDVITQLARVDDMKVAFSVPERYLGDLKRGVSVLLSTPAYPHENFEGRVSVVDPMVDPGSRTIQVVARIPNRGARLRPGMSADVSVTFAVRSGALVIPDEAVFAEGNQSFVFVVKPDSTVARTAIELGTRDSMRVEVLRGLEAGAVVVRAGHQKLFDTAHVIPVYGDRAPASGPAGEATGASGKRGT